MTDVTRYDKLSVRLTTCKLLVKRLHEDARMPEKSHTSDLGYDLFSLENVMLGPNVPTKVRTGIACQFPSGYGAIIKDRSGTASKKSLHVVAGVIDQGYTGEIVVVLANYNERTKWHAIEKGEKFAQMLLYPVINFPIEEVDEIVSSDGRGSAGFGSTGS